MRMPMGLRREHGQGLVEFALALPIFMLLVVGILDFALIIWYRNSVAEAAMEGTRFAIVRGAEWTEDHSGSTITVANVQDRVRSYGFGMDPAGLTVIVTPDPLGARALRSSITVDVAYRYTPLTTLVLGGIPLTVRGKSVAEFVY